MYFQPGNTIGRLVDLTEKNFKGKVKTILHARKISNALCTVFATFSFTMKSRKLSSRPVLKGHFLLNYAKSENTQRFKTCPNN